MKKSFLGSLVVVATLLLLSCSNQTKNKHATIGTGDLASEAVTTLLEQCSAYKEGNKYISPAGANAYSCYQKVLRLDTNNVKAKAGVQGLVNMYLDKGKDNLKQNRLASAKDSLRKLKSITGSETAIVILQQAIASYKNKFKLGIMTGSKTGTYYQFGLDISKILKDTDISLTVHNSKGSLVNMYAVLVEPYAQLAIVQSDVLKFLASLSNDKAKKMVKKTRLVYPLYNEEVHILAHNKISDIFDLAGHKVAVGSKGSGTFLTAKTLLKLESIEVEPVYASGKTALQMLKNGEIDAMFYVAGYPVSLFEKSVTLADDLQLLEITSKSITEFYTPSKIPSSAYQWLKDDVNSVAVKAVLMTFDYKGDNCRNVFLVAEAIKNSLGELRRNGHAKWNEVDLNYKLPGWKKYGCLKDIAAKIE